MSETKRTKLGRYESWMDNCGLHLQHHQFGRSNGFSTCMDPKETLALLELLEQHRNEIYEAAGQREPAHAVAQSNIRDTRWNWS